MKNLLSKVESRRSSAKALGAARELAGSRASHLGSRPVAGFTMIEIALCLGIIGFALVAIIGVLPAGLNVQKANREETIVDQDAAVWMNAIRNGAQGFDDLTNSVIGITNYWTQYKADGTVDKSNNDGYSFSGSIVRSLGLPADVFPLTNGQHIIGLLSMPKYLPPAGPLSGGPYQSNYVVAYVQAMSGSAVEKAPQDNQTVRLAAFAYKMIPEIISYVPVDTNAVNASATYRHFVWNLQTNLHDIRLTFRWPYLPNGDVGNGRLTFRSMAGGSVASQNLFGQQVYFFQSSTYTINAP